MGNTASLSTVHYVHPRILLEKERNITLAHYSKSGEIYPLDCKESNQSILKEISPEYSLEGLMLNLKLQYFGHLMQRANSFEKTLMLGKIEAGREGDGSR